MKYIIFNGRFVVIFPSYLNHDETAFLHRGLGTPTSAGFIKFDEYNQKLYCYGKSISLKLKSQKGDDEIVNKSLIEF